MARPLALAAAVAVSLLAVSGAGGAGAANADTRRHGRLRAGRRRRLMLECRCAVYGSRDRKVSFLRSLGPDLTLRPQLVSGVEIHEEASVHAHVPHPSRGSVERPTACYCARLRLHPRGHREGDAPRTPTHSTIRDNHGSVHSIRVLDAKTVRVVLRTRAAGWRNLFPTVLPRHALVGEDLATVWRDGIHNPKTGRPIGSGPFLVDKWERGKQLTLVRNPSYWGPHAPTSTGSSCGSNEEEAEPRRRSRCSKASARASSTSRSAGTRASCRPSANAGSQGRRAERRTSGSTSTSGRVLGAIPHFRTSSSVARSHTGWIESPSCDGSSLSSTRRTRRATTPSSSAATSHYRPNWNAYRYRPDESRRLLERAGCRAGADGIYVCAGRRLQLRLVTTAGASHRIRTIELVQAQLRRAGIGTVPSSRRGRCFSSRSSPAATTTSLLFALLVGFDASDKKSRYGCGAPATTRATASGSLTRTSTRLTGSSTRTRQPRPRTGPTGSWRRTYLSSRSTSCLMSWHSGRRSGTSTLHPPTSSGMRRTGGSTASPGSGARRLAPRRVGSGRRSRADAEARRHRRRRARSRSRRV